MSLMEERHELEEEYELEQDVVAGEKIKNTILLRPSIWQTIRRFFFMLPGEKSAEQQQSLHDLTEAIEQFPDTAVNYLLRGELYIAMKQHNLAQEDLQKALELAQMQFEDDRWGISAQLTMDRAKFALQKLMQQ